MRHLLRVAKRIYYFFFTRVAYAAVRKTSLSARQAQASRRINIICRFGVQNGLTNGANYHARALERLGHDVQCVDITPTIKNPFKTIACDKDAVFIFHCAASQFVQQAWPLRESIKNAKRIGYFAWESSEAPVNWPVYDDVWDEIWTTSSFSAQGLAKLYKCPIYVVPHVMEKYSAAPRVWAKGQEPLVFLAMADARSGLTRKNPAAAVKAFQKAFPVEQDVKLVIKLQGSKDIPEIKAFIKAVADDPRITILMQTLSREEVDALVATSHVFVSLHRAEGFGLPLLEARMAGLAVIATAWSGNMDFMTEEDSVLVPARVVEMFDESGVYGTISWADPDGDFAAQAMRRMYDEPDYMAAIARAGWQVSSPENQLESYDRAIKAAGL
ncbi:MAG: glycosyltransferase family 4 protein [Alphaproteobacteria bacterium]|jgi:glycosyltransferase involved in cell wall biosynthesis|nr:glycosyltransferase family 4 protein [Alphaproteobacteria bacterium]